MTAARVFEEKFEKIIQNFLAERFISGFDLAKKVPDPNGSGSGSTTMKPIGQKTSMSS